MSDSSPSADEIASELIKQQLIRCMEVENPKLHKYYINKINKEESIATIYVVIFLFIVLFFVFLSIYNYNITFIYIGLVVLVLSFFAFGFIHDGGDLSSWEVLKKFDDDVIKRDMSSNATIEKVAKMIDEDEALITGDKIIAHAGATVINRSTVVRSFNSVRSDDPDLARALSILAGFIEKSANRDAADVFSDLAEEIEGGSRPTRIRAFWNELVRILPDTAKMTTAAATITKLFT